MKAFLIFIAVIAIVSYFIWVQRESDKNKEEAQKWKDKYNKATWNNKQIDWEDYDDDYVSDLNIEWTEEDEKKERERKNREEWLEYFKTLERRSEMRRNPNLRINFKKLEQPEWKCPKDLQEKYSYYL